MTMSNSRNVLISGASFAGLATAFWMKQRGDNVTIVEIADGLKTGGTPVNIRGDTVDILKRMDLFDPIRANRLIMERVEWKNASDVTVRWSDPQEESLDPAGEEFEIERDVLLRILFDAVRDDVELMFGDSITSLTSGDSGVSVSFQGGSSRSFDLVFGCDGIHSAVRRLWFGPEERFSYFLGAYGSTTILDSLLIQENTTQIYNEPGKAVMLNAYNGKTDVVLIFAADQEISYDFRNDAQKRQIVIDHFSGAGWRTPQLLREVAQSDAFYFDKLCQIRMPSWTRGPVALVGDAGYCASPAAGMGGSLAIDGAGALAAAFATCGDDVEAAFAEYNRSFRPFVEEVQANAVSFGLDLLLPRTVDVIHDRTEA
jgi:2-polyprenyl-6-methoxyphenol hydroxylase-like FAD-dependent oxidoreductase